MSGVDVNVILNPARLIGDTLLVFGHVAPFYHVFTSNNLTGFSLKSAELYALMFFCRYLDMFVSLHSFPASLGCVGTALRVRFFLYECYGAEKDVFPIAWAILLSVLLTPFVSISATLHELSWTFSTLLESFALFPSLIVLRRTQRRSIPSPLLYSIIALGCFRLFYLLNWAWRFLKGVHLFPLAIVTGTFQTGAFLYLMWKRRM